MKIRWNLFFITILLFSLYIVHLQTALATLVPPLERAPATDPRLVDSQGNLVTGVIQRGHQVQIAADLTNNQDKEQPFAYIVEISDQTGAVVSLSWLSGSLDSNQMMSPSQSWIPNSSGNYTAEIFVWQSVNNPDALSPSLKIPINVD